MNLQNALNLFLSLFIQPKPRVLHFLPNKIQDNRMYTVSNSTIMNKNIANAKISAVFIQILRKDKKIKSEFQMLEVNEIDLMLKYLAS